MHKNYISISPILSEKELNIFNLFNELCEANMQIKQPQGYSVWLHDKSGSFKDGFEIIHAKKTPDETIENYNKIFNELESYSNCLFFRENIDIVMNYQNIFLKTNLTHKHSENYLIDTGTETIISHLIKIVNIFHKNGFLKKFLGLDTDHHIISKVVINNNTDDAYIIDETDIFTAKILDSGYYTKTEIASQKWCEELIKIIEKKKLQDKLKKILTLKKSSILKKI